MELTIEEKEREKDEQYVKELQLEALLIDGGLDYKHLQPNMIIYNKLTKQKETILSVQKDHLITDTSCSQHSGVLVEDIELIGISRPKPITKKNQIMLGWWNW